jgi:shikimate kinase
VTSDKSQFTFMNLLLIGYRGSGKSTVGRLLADCLHMPLIDTDELIVQRAGTDIATIFAQHGEQKFRDLETQALKESLRCDGQILSLGGGAIVRDENRQAIKSHPANKVFYLHCDAGILHQRITADHKTAAHRPALTPFAGAIAEVGHLLAQRLPWYREVMSYEIDVSNLAPSQAAERIIELYNLPDRADKRT